jgi:DNA-directed RNA polymerase subunit RPC12/RpoP
LQPNAFDVLVGLRLSIIRRAADMLVLHFGTIRPHSSGEGTVADYALHVQCPWRLDSPNGTVTGRDDLWEHAGPGERPPNWSYDDGLSLQDKKFAELFVRDQSTRSWVNESDGFGVATVRQTERGDVTLSLINGYEILIFPAGSGSEAWRLFAPGSGRHLVFPSPERDYAISRRKNVDNSEWEAWLKVVEAPKTGEAMQAPPTIIVTANGTRYRCGRCGRVLVIAEFGALKDFVIRCTSCDSYNVVSI